VIYIEGAFTRLTGSTDKIWLRSLAIIHELSHHEARTADLRCADGGLKPTKDGFPYDHAMRNADNWAFFALNLAGFLSNSDLADALR
jgi:hypothetical protein